MVDIPLGLDIFTGARPWAMRKEELAALIDKIPAWEAVAARLGRPLGRNRSVENHNGVALMDVRGPLFRYRSIFTWLLGGTAVEDAAIDLHTALDDPSVRAIVMSINSPGGQIDGINEFAEMIRAANAVKPVTAYVEGLAASGGYWLAAAAGRIVADETAQLGSIGVRTTIEDTTDADERKGVKRYDIISSQSPLKATDPSTDAGRASLQEMVDSLADVFIGKVAAFRQTSPEDVSQNFGRGAVVLARRAVAAGMADAIGSLDSLMASDDALMMLRDKPGMRVAAALPVAQTSTTLAIVTTVAAPATAAADDEPDPFDEEQLEEDTEAASLAVPDTCPGAPDPDEANESEGTIQGPDTSSIPEGETDLLTPSTDRQRIAAILTCEEAKGREELARKLALETNHTVDAAKALLAAAPQAVAPVVVAAPNALDARMTELQNPKVGAGNADEAATSVAAEVGRILAHVPKTRLRAQVN